MNLSQMLVTPLSSDTLYRLGNLCKRQHDWCGTGQSVRLKTDGGCIECRREYHKTYVRKTRVEDRRERQRRYYAKNSDKKKARVKAYDQAHPEARAERGKRYRKRHPEAVRIWATRRRSNKKQALRQPYTLQQLRVQYLIFQNCCAYCGNKCSLTLDHVVALSRGGVDGISNIVPACRSCNGSKNATDVFEWYSRQSFYSLERWQHICSNTSLSEFPTKRRYRLEAIALCREL